MEAPGRRAAAAKGAQVLAGRGPDLYAVVVPVGNEEDRRAVGLLARGDADGATELAGAAPDGPETEFHLHGPRVERDDAVAAVVGHVQR